MSWRESDTEMHRFGGTSQAREPPGPRAQLKQLVFPQLGKWPGGHSPPGIHFKCTDC
jgi:hypothetical protein